MSGHRVVSSAVAPGEYALVIPMARRLYLESSDEFCHYTGCFGRKQLRNSC